MVGQRSRAERQKEEKKNNKKNTNNENKRVTFNEDIKYKTRSVTSSINKRRKEKVKRKSPGLAKIQRRTRMTSTTSEEYKNNKRIQYYIRNQTKTKNIVKAESQPIPDITIRRAQKIIPKEEKN